MDSIYGFSYLGAILQSYMNELAALSRRSAVGGAVIMK
jgi:hypothetical protein